MKICDFTRPEVQYFLEQCNFTKEQAEIFILFAEGRTNEETAEMCNCSVSTIKRTKSQIRAKIERIKSL